MARTDRQEEAKESLTGLVEHLYDQLDDGFFELTLIRKPQTPVELGQIVQLLHHGRQDGSLVIRRPVTRCVFRGQEGLDWSLDGECVPGGAQVGVEVLPQALELVY